MTPAVFLTILCLGVASCAPALDPSLDTEWQEWKTKYEKSYSLEEEGQKRAVWEKNLRKIKLHNGENGSGKNGFTMELNAFSDMTNKEFRKSLTNIQVPAGQTNNANQDPVDNGLPKSIDWRTKGYVTHVRKQGKCSSCWSFATAGAIEGQYFWKTGKLIPLSAQNLVDCSRRQGNSGCQGGVIRNAFQYVYENKGIEAEATYPYEGKDGPCRYQPENSITNITDFVCLPPREEYVEVAVAAIGPVAAAVDASFDTFRFYKGGIYYEPRCSSYALNHGVLIVGYGFEGNETDGNKYWLVKNSWGKEWGIDGYMKIAKGRGNHCGIASYATYPDIF